MSKGNLVGRKNDPSISSANGVWGLRENYRATYDEKWPDGKVIFKGAVTAPRSTGPVFGTLPAHNAGDLIVVYGAGDYGSASASMTSQTDPAGWIKIGSQSQTYHFNGLFYRVATSSSTVGGSWYGGGYNFVCLAAMVFSGQNTAFPIGSFDFAQSTTSAPAITISNTGNSQVVGIVVGYNGGNAAAITAPVGYKKIFDVNDTINSYRSYGVVGRAGGSVQLIPPVSTSTALSLEIKGSDQTSRDMVRYANVTYYQPGSWYSPLADYSNMNNGTNYTFASGYSYAAATTDYQQYIRADCGYPRHIGYITLGYDYQNKSLGTGATNNSGIYGSNDASTWTLIKNTPTYESPGNYVFSGGMTIIPIDATYRYLKLQNGWYTFAGEFGIFGSRAAGDTAI